MKIKVSRKAKQLASSLLVVLVIGTILSVSVAGYLSLVEQQNMLSTRSQGWNVAIAVVEAGIEEGVQQLNNTMGSLASNGWTRWGLSNIYYRSQTLADGNTYFVFIDASDSSDPIVTARASVTLPTFAKNRLTSMFAYIGPTQPTANTVTRAVRVRCSRSNLYAGCMVAKHVIDLNGNGVYTDSYDSSDSAKSSNTHYDSAKYSGNYGDIASNGGIIDSIGVQNANIYGVVHTGPDEPVTIGSQGGVGPHGGQVNDISVAIQNGYILQDANFTFPDTTMPSIAGLFEPMGGTNVGPVYAFTTNAVTSPNYPIPEPASGVATNIGFVTVPTLPSPIPAGLVTNSASHTVSTPPGQAYPGMITNIFTTSTTAQSYPAPGSYVGGVTTNYNGNGNSKKIDGYTYNKITSVTYTYTSYSYTYPSYSYTYDLTVTSINYTTNYYDHIVHGNTTNYSYSLSGKTLIDGPNACLILPNGLTGSEDFHIAQGASVLIYAGGTEVTINGNQVVNPNGFAGSFIVYCPLSVTKFNLNGNGTFTGVLVAPAADLNMNGGGNNNLDFCGSLMVNNVKMNGHFSFHWDESLGRMARCGRYIIKSWDEINPYTWH